LFNNEDLLKNLNFTEYRIFLLLEKENRLLEKKSFFLIFIISSLFIIKIIRGFRVCAPLFFASLNSDDDHEFLSTNDKNYNQ